VVNLMSDEPLSVHPRKTRILVADESGIVRASLLGMLRESFEMREAVDGEAALQAVLLDNLIRILIVDIELPKIDGLELLSRIRASTLPRIRDLPVVILVRAEREFDRNRAIALGATDVVLKTTKAAELIARLDILAQLSTARESLAETQANLNASRATDPETNLHNLAYFDRQVEKLISYARRNLANVAVICMHVSFAGPKAKAGEKDHPQWLARVGQSLSSTIRLEDLGARSDRAEFCLATQVTGMVDVLRFATRLRRVVESLDLGNGVEIRTCLGVASLTEDMRRNAEELRTIAQRRAQQAKGSRTRRIVLGSTEVALTEAKEEKADESVMDVGLALALIRNGRATEVMPQLSKLLQQIEPLMRLAQQQDELKSLHSTNRPEK
jgi:diguanylate cyclase (GGDEF)-like protein